MNLIDPYGLETVLPAPVPLPIIMPKTEAQIEADRQLADWLRTHYNPNWFQDIFLLWNDPINYWMAKGGKQNIDNEYVRDVQNEGIGDPCAYLRQLYNDTCDKKERRKIKQALKRFNCDGKDRYQ